MRALSSVSAYTSRLNTVTQWRDLCVWLPGEGYRAYDAGEEDDTYNVTHGYHMSPLTRIFTIARYANHLYNQFCKHVDTLPRAIARVLTTSICT